MQPDSDARVDAHLRGFYAQEAREAEAAFPAEQAFVREDAAAIAARRNRLLDVAIAGAVVGLLAIRVAWMDDATPLQEALSANLTKILSELGR